MSFRDELFIATDLLKEWAAAADAVSPLVGPSHNPPIVADVSVSCCVALLVMYAAAVVWEEWFVCFLPGWLMLLWAATQHCSGRLPAHNVERTPPCCLSFNVEPLSFPSLHSFYCKDTLSNWQDVDIRCPAAVGVKSSFFWVFSVPLQDRHLVVASVYLQMFEILESITLVKLFLPCKLTLEQWCGTCWNLGFLGKVIGVEGNRACWLPPSEECQVAVIRFTLTTLKLSSIQPLYIFSMGVLAARWRPFS